MTTRPGEGRGGVTLDIADEEGFEVQSQHRVEALVSKGIIAAPYVDSDDGDEVGERDALARKLLEFASKEVDPAVGLRVAKGRQVLTESGILDDLVRMRHAHKPRPRTASHTRPPRAEAARPESAVPSQRAASGSAARRLPSHVVRRRKMSPMYSRFAEENDTNLKSTFNGDSIRRLTRPLSHHVNHSRPESQGKPVRPDLDESVYTGHAFAGRTQNLRPASAPPERVRLDMHALRSFNEAVARGERPEMSFENEKLEEELPSDILRQQDVKVSRSLPGTANGLTSIDMLTAPEFEHIPLERLIPSLFGSEVVQRPHRGLLQLASKKLVEGKHAKSMKGAMKKLTDDWTLRRGQWDSRSWSVFGADSKKDALWFGRKGKGIAALANGPATNPPVDFELEMMMKRFGISFRHKMWTTMGIRSAEEIMTIRNKDFENMGFSDFDRKLLRREAAKIVAQGDRPTRIRRRLADAISKHVQDDATLFVQKLKGLFLAAGGADEQIPASHIFQSLHEGGIIDVALLRESAFLPANVKELRRPTSPSLHTSHIHTYLSSEAYAHSSERAGSPTLSAMRDNFCGLQEPELTLHECLRMLWIVESAPGSNAYTFQKRQVPDTRHELTVVSKASQDFFLTPRSPSRTLTLVDAQAGNSALNEECLYDPILPHSPDALETSYMRMKEQQGSGGGGGSGGADQTNQGAPWLDMTKLCVFVESCNAVRDQGRPRISLRGTGHRYPTLALQVVQGVEQLQVEMPTFVDNNVMDHKTLVSTASRRGAKQWAEKWARSMKFADGTWPKFPRFGSFEVWALVPGKAEPQCIFSKVKEKRFPSKNEVMSRLADTLQAKLEEIAPMCEYVVPPKKERICAHCEMGRLVDNQCNWCASIQKERRGRTGTSGRGA